MKIVDLLQLNPYQLLKKEKQRTLNSILSELTKHHYQHSILYKSMMDAIGFNIKISHDYKDIPFLPVRLFKLLDLKSVVQEEIVKTMTSSGTSGQAVSKIYLDKETTVNQTKVLAKIIASFLGKQRLPMLVLDSASVVKDRNLFSARGAGILGFSLFGTERVYALNDKMELDVELVQEFLKQNKEQRIFLFGFTFMIWQHFYKELVKKGIKFDLSNAILIHGGGWKKLEAESISSSEFKKKLREISGIEQVYDYYGMVEQTGSIYMECEQGHLHTSIFSDVIIRRPIDFTVADKGEKGIIQVVSVLPKSYPGHSLLTEDEGILLGEDTCSCGRKGKYFKITGRLKNAEIRGCSDVYATKF